MSAKQRMVFKDQRKKTLQEHLDYMERVVPELLEAEAKVDAIKNSEEWKRHYGYFQTIYNRGGLKERPTKKNGYKIELGNNLVALADIEDLLTPEQLEAIKRRM